jgi:hypothetical protein
MSQKDTKERRKNFVLCDPEGARYSFIGNQLRCTNKGSTADVSVKREHCTGPWKLHGKHNSEKCPCQHGPGSSLVEWVIATERQQKIDIASLEEKKAQDLKKKNKK